MIEDIKMTAFWIVVLVAIAMKKGAAWAKTNDKAKEIGKAAADKAIRRWLS